jgi:hypothetical protein
MRYPLAPDTAFQVISISVVEITVAVRPVGVVESCVALVVDALTGELIELSPLMLMAATAK